MKHPGYHRELKKLLIEPLSVMPSSVVAQLREDALRGWDQQNANRPLDLPATRFFQWLMAEELTKQGEVFPAAIYGVHAHFFEYFTDSRIVFAHEGRYYIFEPGPEEARGSIRSPEPQVWLRTHLPAKEIAHPSSTIDFAPLFLPGLRQMVANADPRLGLVFDLLDCFTYLLFGRNVYGPRKVLFKDEVARQQHLASEAEPLLQHASLLALYADGASRRTALIGRSAGHFGDTGSTESVAVAELVVGPTEWRYSCRDLWNRDVEGIAIGC